MVLRNQLLCKDVTELFGLLHDLFAFWVPFQKSVE